MIAASWWTARTEQLELHMWSGYAILTLILFRVLWGVFGSSTARFSTFVRGPRAVIAYVRESAAWKAVGHSPLGALSVVAMIVVLKLQVATGLINADDDGLVEGPLAKFTSLESADFIHSAHAWLFDALLVLIALHVAAILFYRLVLGRDLVTPMITGDAAATPEAQPLQPARKWTALACLAAAGAVAWWLVVGAPPFGV